MTPSPTKEAMLGENDPPIERLRHRAWAFGDEKIAVVYTADLKALLASHDKLVEGLRRSIGVMDELRTPDMNVSAAHVYARIVEADTRLRALLKELGQ